MGNVEKEKFVQASKVGDFDLVIGGMQLEEVLSEARDISKRRDLVSGYIQALECGERREVLDKADLVVRQVEQPEVWVASRNFLYQLLRYRLDGHTVLWSPPSEAPLLKALN